MIKIKAVDCYLREVFDDELTVFVKGLAIVGYNKRDIEIEIVFQRDSDKVRDLGAQIAKFVQFYLDKRGHEKRGL